MASWPAILPNARYDGYSLEPQDPVVRTDFDAGPSRSRRAFTVAPTIVPLAFSFNAEQMRVFEAWHRYGINDGASWFDSFNILTGLGIVSVTARFKEMWKATPRTDGQWIVSAKVEIDDRPLMTEAELSSYL